MPLKEKMSFNYLNLTARSTKVLTRNDLRKMIIKKAIIGDISNPSLRVNGNNLLIGFSTGSVTW